MNSDTVRKGILALIVANVIWGFASPIFKWSLQNVPPYTLAFLRFFIASILLGLYLKGKIRLPIRDKQDLWLLVAYAFSGITVNIIFFFLGLQLTFAMNAPIIASSAPIMTFILAFLLLREKPKWKKVAGMLIGTLGIAVIVLEPILFTGIDGSLLGNFYLVLATIGAVGGTITGRKIFQKYDPIVLMFWAFIIGTASFFPLAWYEYAKNPLLYAVIDSRGYIGIVYGAIFSSAVAYTLFSWGLSKIPANEASMFSYIDPIAGTVLSYFMLHEPITNPFIIGSILIFGGIFIAEHRIHYHPLGKLKVKSEN